MIKKIRQQFADTVHEIGLIDPKLVVMVGDISHGIMKNYAEACPGRYFNIGILEPTMVSIGAGLSRVGHIPVLHTIAPFLLERSFEQIKLDFCYHKLPGNIVTVGSAFDYAYLGCTHHCYGDFALLKTLENTQIVYPSTTDEFHQLFKQAYANDLLTIYRIPENSHKAEIFSDDIQLGKAVKITEGTDFTIIATGPQLSTAIDAEAELKKNGISVDVVYIHTIRPLDVEAIRASITKTKRVIVLEEHVESGGLGDDILRSMKNSGAYTHISISIPDKFIRNHNSYEGHCKEVGLTVENVVNKIKENLGK